MCTIYSSRKDPIPYCSILGVTPPTVHGELQHHARGCYSTHSAVKYWNRRAENLLLAAEKFSALAGWLVDLPYPDDFERAWKNVLFNQFHDILAGTSIAAAYDDARETYGEALAIARRALNRAVQAIARRVRIANCQTATLVFNPHAWEVRACVEVELERALRELAILADAGREIPFQITQPHATVDWRTRLCFIAELPAMGYRTYQVVPRAAERATHLRGSAHVPLRLEFDPETPWQARLFETRNGWQVFRPPGVRAVVYDDPSDTWGHGVARFDRVAGEFGAARVETIEDGAVRTVGRVERVYRASRLVEEWVVYRELERIDVRVTVDWREQFKVLKLRFPVNIANLRATHAIPYGFVERAATGAEEPMQSWVDVSDETRGLSILNDGKHSVDVNGSDIGVTVLRSPIYAHHEPAVPDPTRHYEFLDQGVQQFTLSLVPHTGDWRDAQIPRRAAELNQPPVVVLVGSQSQGALLPRAALGAVDAANVIVSVLKKAEEDDALILRAHETAGVATDARIRLPRFNREIRARFGACEIKTWKIPRAERVPITETNLLEEANVG